MKKVAVLFCALVLMFEMTSCATIVGGKVTTSQKIKPGPGEPVRQVKVGALLADIIFFGGAGLIIDLVPSSPRPIDGSPASLVAYPGPLCLFLVAVCLAFS